MNILNIFDPNIFPTAISGFEIRTDVRLVVTSGSEVAPPNKRVPTSNPPRGVLPLKISALLDSSIAAKTVMMAANPKII